MARSCSIRAKKSSKVTNSKKQTGPKKTLMKVKAARAVPAERY